MNTFISFDGIRISYRDEAKAPLSFCCMDSVSMHLVSSEILTAYARYSKRGSICFARFLAGRPRCPILPRRAGRRIRIPASIGSMLSSG